MLTERGPGPGAIGRIVMAAARGGLRTHGRACSGTPARGVIVGRGSTRGPSCWRGIACTGACNRVGVGPALKRAALAPRKLVITEVLANTVGITAAGRYRGRESPS